MKEKKGFALVESIFMIVFLSVALLLVYKAFASSFQDERRRIKYDNTTSIYELYFIKQYFEENGILDYLTTATLTDGYLEINCSTITSNNSEYCDFLTSFDSFDVNKIYITKYDMDGVAYDNLDPTTIDYFKTLSGTDTISYRIIVWFNNDQYASMKLGVPYHNLLVLLNGGTWTGTNSQTLIEGETTNILNPVKDGYIFLGWSINGAGSSVVDTTFTMGTEDTIIVATWMDYSVIYTYTGDYQTFSIPLTGYYQLEVWGAEGGSYDPTLGQQKGAYASGYISLNKDDVIYIYVGGAGTTNGNGTTIPGGFNGGGTALGYSDSNNGSGGGATDIRLDTSLNSRILIAAGGGGTVGPTVASGNYGGSLIATNAVWTAGSTYTATGGTQISAGGGTVSGAFGQGANGGTTYRAGGGGGYYGGGVHTYTGAGGSSFISGYAGSNAITSSSSTTATNNTIHYSNNYFINGSMATSVNSGNGYAKITFIGEEAPTRINTNLNNVRYIKDCVNGNTTDTTASWVELQAIYQGINVAKGKTVTGTSAQNASYPYTRIVDGDITPANFAISSVNGAQCVTVDLGQTYNLDEVAVWHYWLDGRTVYSNVTSVSNDNSSWSTAISSLYAENSQGKRINAYQNDYPYTGAVQTFTVPYTGNYKIELWGASGGNGSATYTGGMGGYTKGEIYLTKDTDLYIYVGGVGPAVGTATNTAGGYNGGGNCYSYAANYVTGCGGGATDIRTTSGVWNNSTSLASRIMVAGGGGGGHYRSDTSSKGGQGGGLTGNISYGETSAYGKLYPTGGSQTAGGAKGYVDASSRITSLTDSGFGYGGSVNASALTWNLIGGGSGYWGGGAGVFMAGSAGSSYISGHTGCIAITSSSSTSPRTGTAGAPCSQGGTDNLCSIHYSGNYFTNTLMIDGADYTWTNIKASKVGTNAMPRPNGGSYQPGYGNTGNGYAKITYIGN